MINAVDMVNCALVCPAGMTTELGMLSKLDGVAESTTVSPPTGAGAEIVTVPVAWLILCNCVAVDERVINLGPAVTLSVAVKLWGDFDAVMLTLVATFTAVVFTVKLAEVCPEGTVTEAGILATFEFSESETTNPLAGAVPLSVTVPTEVPPPRTVVGESDKPVNVTGGGGAAWVRAR